MNFAVNRLRAVVLGYLMVHGQILQAQLPALLPPEPQPQLGHNCALDGLGESYRNEKGEVIGNGHPIDAIPFQLDGGFLILVDGRIGSLAPLKFVLDTGTTHTVISRKIADRLIVPRHQGQGRVLNFDREVKLEWTRLPELQLGPVVARGSGTCAARGAGLTAAGRRRTGGSGALSRCSAPGINHRLTVDT